MHELKRVQQVIKSPANLNQDEEDNPSSFTPSPPPALDQLCQAFKLSPFERDLLLLCAGVDLDGNFASLLATMQRDDTKKYPTFSLALAAPENADW